MLTVRFKEFQEEMDKVGQRFVEFRNETLDKIFHLSRLIITSAL